MISAWPWLVGAIGLLALGRPSASVLRLSSSVPVLRRAAGAPDPTVDDLSATGSRPAAADPVPVGRWPPWSGRAVADFSPGQVRSGALAVVTAAGLLTLGSGGRVGLALTAGLLAGHAVTTTHRRLLDRSRVRDGRALEQAFALLEAELMAGAREGDALAAAAPIAGRYADRFAVAAATARMGGDVAAALIGDASAAKGGGRVEPPGRGSDPLRPLAAAWRVRADCGAPLAELVGRVSRDLERRTALAREVDTALAGPRASGALLTVLPVLGLVMGTAMGAHPVAFLFGTRLGSVVLLAGVGADLLGALWVAGLVRRARR